MIHNKKIICIILLLVVVVSSIYLFVHSDGDTREFESYMFNSPNSNDILTVNEWHDLKNSGDIFFLQRGKEKIYLGEVTTNKYLPFKSNQYDLLWEDDKIIVRYKYGLLQEWKQVVLDTADKKRQGDGSSVLTESKEGDEIPTNDEIAK